MWSNWSRAEKIVFVVVVSLAAWEGAGAAYLYATTPAQGGGPGNAFGPIGPHPQEVLGCNWLEQLLGECPGGNAGLPGGGGGFACIESPSQFASCVSQDILNSISAIWTNLLPFLETYLANLASAVLAAIAGAISAVENAIAGGVQSIVVDVLTPFNWLFNLANQAASSFGPLSPIIVTLIVVIGVVGLIALLGLVVLLLWGAGKTAYNAF
ncbi:MAG TPA: hypothetical protein VGU43_04555 [Thermoplasmata archaeon]|nr:hypothetical protein [Thermoplasmata archaeon]